MGTSMEIIKTVVLVVISWFASLFVTIFGGYFIFGYQGSATMDKYEWVAHLFHYGFSIILIGGGCRIFQLRIIWALMLLLVLLIIEWLFFY